MLDSAPELIQVHRDVRGAAVVLHVSGELDQQTSAVLEGHLRQAEALVRPPGPVVVDLGGVTFFGSSGLSLMLTHHLRCAGRGTCLRLVAGHRAVLRPIEVTDLGSVLSVLPSVERALEIPRQRSD
ncbi:MAG: STAS domain-containing protein [Saccharothrix sp.]|nr:STAS domain-containing protein [Saccharothrix sp.]